MFSWDDIMAWGESEFKRKSLKAMVYNCFVGCCLSHLVAHKCCNSVIHNGRLETNQVD